MDILYYISNPINFDICFISKIYQKDEFLAWLLKLHHHTLTGLTPSSVMYRAIAGREEMSPGVALQSLSNVTHSGCP